MSLFPFPRWPAPRHWYSSRLLARAGNKDFDFGNRDPREAIVEEIRELATGLTSYPDNLPKSFYKVGSSYLKQPVAFPLNVTK